MAGLHARLLGLVSSDPLLHGWTIADSCHRYTFPPLLSETIAKDLDLTPKQVANSNIVSLVSTFFLRFLAGPLCDQFGSRNVFASLLLVGCLPIGLAPLVKNATGLYVSRFFIGVLGATFVPCQVWCTGFFDKNVVGTANAFAGG